MNVLKQWMAAATVAEQKQLALAAQTSRQYLYQLSNGYRSASTDLAGRIEIASEPIRKMSKGRLPKITRMDLCNACEVCPYAIKQTNHKKT